MLSLLTFSRRHAASVYTRSGRHRECKKDGSRGSQVTEIHRRLAEFARTTVALPSSFTKYAVESIVAEQQIRCNADQYAAIHKRREEEERKYSKNTESAKGFNLAFPLAQNIEVDHYRPDGPNLRTVDFPAHDNVGDNGFYIQGDQYVDEYIAGTSADVADEEMTMACSSREVFGPEDAVEHIDFQLPGQSTLIKLAESQSETETDWTERFGSVDLDRPASKKQCAGCGAHFHCMDSSLPGFLPVEVFEKVDVKKQLFQLCKRCHLLKHHKFLLNVNVCHVDYATMMSHLKMKEEALILLVVDMTDLPGSIHPHLPNIIGEKKPMIVVANKVDLLPPDSRCGYLKRAKNVLETIIDDSGLKNRFNILHTALVSAKTGYGIEDLITEIHMKCSNLKMGLRADMYLVGCTNAGKSTMFNALLQSDLCKVRAVDLVERATTSIWPGTTVSLLKFPVMKPSPFRLELRRRRLLANRVWHQKENYARKLMLQQTGDSKYAVLTGLIQNTYKEQEEDLQPISLQDLQSQSEVNVKERKRSWSLKDEIFAKGAWCYDTPGTVNENQLLELFTLPELIRVLPRRLLQPRTAILAPGHSLVIGGVAVVDLVSTEHGDNILLSTFANEELPLNVMPTNEVNTFLLRYNCAGALVVPEGGKERMELWPAPASKTFHINGCSDGGSVDLVLSSVGWVLVTSRGSSVLRAFTPGGRGLAVRPPLLPFAAELRGKRIPGTQFYNIKPVEFPVNERRIKAKKNKRKFGKS